MEAYAGLPQEFQVVRPITFNQASDIYGFQAASIAASFQLLRIMLLAPDIASVEQSCLVVQEVIQTFAEVPCGYLQATSTPLLHHLGTIGSYLASRYKDPITDGEWNLTRQTLLGLSDLLRNLGTRALQ